MIRTQVQLTDAQARSLKAQARLQVGAAGAREGIIIGDLTGREGTEYALELVCGSNDGTSAPIVTVHVPPFPFVAYSRRAH